jgi:DNA-binding CsgD family transcriptional regulator
MLRREKVAEDAASGRFGRPVYARFPPEPNGFLHIGHARSICLNSSGDAVGKRNLRAAFRLTEAEADVAVESAAGSGLETVARSRGVSLATVRTQLQRVYDKTGVRGPVGPGGPGRQAPRRPDLSCARLRGMQPWSGTVGSA